METIIQLCCKNCGMFFDRRLSLVNYNIRVRNRRHAFCSRRCYLLFNENQIEKTCCQCYNTFARKKGDIRQNERRNKSGNHFCSQSCAATYNNLHKTTGNRRSKLEVWLEEQLRTLYPNLEILFNTKETINAELDIYFPNLRLAFELNGIYHYEPIHGGEKLTSIQTNDHRKFAACIEKGIALCVVDVSTMKNFKPVKGQQFLDIIINIVARAGLEPART